MAVDPRHGLRVPSGYRLARVLAGLLRAMRPAAHRAALAGRVFDPGPWAAELAKVAAPLIAHEWELGRRRGAAEVRSRQAPRGVRRKAIAETPPPPIQLAFDVFLPEVSTAAQRLALDLAGSVAAATKDAVRSLLEEGLREGESLADLADRLDGLFAPKRAYTIAATEASRAMHAGQAAAARDGGAAGLEWLASADACEDCEPLNGKRVKWGQAFVVRARGGPYARVEHPPLHPHCLLPGTPVQAVGVRHAMRTWYEGPIVRIEFARGGTVAVTPKHMLLTPDGFLPADAMVEGDHVLRCPLRESVSGLGGDPNHDDVPARIEEVFDAISVATRMRTTRVPVAPEHLHGDAAFCHGDIEVVATDGQLRDQIQPGMGKHGPHLPLVSVRTRRFGVGLAAEGDLSAVLVALLAATNGRMGGSRDTAAALLAHRRHADGVALGHRPTRRGGVGQDPLDYSPGDTERLGQTVLVLAGEVAGYDLGDGQIDSEMGAGSGPPANLNSGAGEILANDDLRDAERISECLHRLPRMVARDKVIKVEKARCWSGHVYDLHTDASMYLVGDGIVSANCMCSTLLWWDD